MAPTYDVIVLGLGGMGSAAAHHLAARGARVLGLEKFGPVHHRGSSHGGSRITRQSYFEDPAYVPLLLRSYQLYEARAGFVRPENTVAAHLQLAVRDGAELHFEEPATRWEELPGGAGVRVHTGENAYTAGQLVICPGAWAPRLLSDLGVPVTIERHVMYWFAPDGGTAPFVPARHPIYIWEDARGVQVYGFPAIDGPDGGAKVAFFRKGTDCTPEGIDRTVHEHEVRAMADQLAPRIPALPGRFLKAATCMYSNTPDEHFVIARHPAHPETTTVACGFSGHGFKFVPVVGEIVADLALTGSTAHPIDLFAPSRRSARETPGRPAAPVA